MKRAIRISILMVGLVGTFVGSSRPTGSRRGRWPDSFVPTQTN